MKDLGNFGSLGPEYSAQDDSAVVIIPVAYDGTSTWVKGADKGPAAIIEASAHMELYDIETDSEVYRRGIFTDAFIEGSMAPETMVGRVEDRVEKWLTKGKFVVVVGGEHSVQIGSVRAHGKRFSALTVLQLDAHADLRDEYDGSKCNHACVMARAREVGPIVQVGVRSMDVSEKENVTRSRMFFAKDIRRKADWIKAVMARLSESVYLTVDVDVFDPAVMPSTGTPEPGGLFWYDVLGLLKTVAVERNMVGFDVVELCPDGRNKAPDFLAAKLIYKLLSYKFQG